MSNQNPQRNENPMEPPHQGGWASATDPVSNPQNKLRKCQLHPTLPIGFFCLDEKKFYCVSCDSRHQGHNTGNIEQVKTIMKNSISECQKALQGQMSHLEELKLSNLSGNFEGEYNTIIKAKEKILQVVDQFFGELADGYKKIVNRIPTEEQKRMQIKNIQDTLVTLNNLSRSSIGDKLDFDDIQQFFTSDYEAFVSSTQEEISFYDKVSSLKPNFLPKLKTNDKILEKIALMLIDFAYFTQQSQEEIKINSPSVENPQKLLSFVSENLLLSYNVESFKTSICKIPSQCPIPYGASTLNILDQGVFLCGGVNPLNKKISGETFYYNNTTKTLKKLKPMVAKVTGHSLIIVPIKASPFNENQIHVPQTPIPASNNQGQSPQIKGNEQSKNIGDPNSSSPVKAFTNSQNEVRYQVFQIGGKSNMDIRTRICQKYDSLTDTWEKIACLNTARSKPSVCLFEKQFIYCFYGTNNRGLTESSIEKYALQLNYWQDLNIQNQASGIESTCMNAFQVENENILLLGGFREKKLLERGEQQNDEVIVNQRIITFNTSENLIYQHKNTLPTSFLSQNNSLIYKESLYTIGGYLSRDDKQTLQLMDNMNVLKIDKSGCTIVKTIDSKETVIEQASLC